MHRGLTDREHTGGHRRIRLAVAGALASVVLLSSGLLGQATARTAGTTPADEGTPVSGGELVISGDAEVANPWAPAAMQCDSYCQMRARTFYDPVAAVGTDNEVHPFLAESFTPNADFTQWTVKMRSGITFTDGEPVNAAAVIRNLQVTGTGLLISKAINDVARVPDPKDASKTILKIEQVDDLTFTIFTGKGGDPSKPVSWPNLPFYLAGQWGLIASPKFLDVVLMGGDSTKPIGSGPFMVESYAPNDKLVVVRNPKYWLKDASGVQLPYLDKITFKVIEDPAVAGTGLRGGSIDAFSTSTPSVIDEFQQDGDYVTEIQDKMGETNYGLIDLSKAGPLQDQRVRCALSMAIDRNEYVDVLANGISKVANGIFSPGEEGYLEDNGFSTEQDVAGAKKLIDEYKAEKGIDKIVIHWGTTNTAANAQRADLLKGWWKEIGVDMEWTQVPQDQFITDALFGKPDFEIFGWRQHAGYPIDNQYYWWHSSGAAPDGSLSLNFMRLNDPIIDENLDKARSALTPDERKAAAQEVNKEFAKQCYTIPFDYAIWGTPHIPQIKGFGRLLLPGSTVLAADGAGFPGAYWTQTLWLNKG